MNRTAGRLMLNVDPTEMASYEGSASSGSDDNSSGPASLFTAQKVLPTPALALLDAFGYFLSLPQYS